MTDPRRAVFLSYASQDAEAAQKVCDALRGAGIEVWFDQSELRGGDAWDSLIRRQIKGCYLFVPIISVNTQSREEGHFRREWKLAVDRTNDMAEDRAFLLPVVIDTTSDSDARVPEKFREVQWTRLPTGGNANAFVAHVLRLLSQDATTPASLNAESSAQPKSPTVSAPPRSTPSVSRSVLVWTVGGVLVLAAGYVVTERLLTSKHTQAVTQSSAAAGVAAVSEKSIAVLPFTDMSEKKDQEYFSDGLSEDLIDLLTKVPDLHVPARASSFYFKGQHATIPEIAKALAVSYVLEGSVRKSGNTVRVRTELIRAENGYNIWSETYDRDLKDVFKVQDEIARQVVAALKVALPSVEVVNTDRTANPEAYNQYLLGRRFEREGGVADLRIAVDAFHKATTLDPTYVDAFSWLGIAEVQLGDITGDPALITHALAMAEHAIALAPNDPSGYTTRGWIRTDWRWDWEGANQDLDKAESLSNGFNSGLKFVRADLAAVEGRLNEAIAILTRSSQHDPLDAYNWSVLVSYLAAAGKFPEAHAVLNRIEIIEPDSRSAHTGRFRLALLEGKADEALAEAGKMSNQFRRLQAIAFSQHSLGHEHESQQALDDLIKSFASIGAFQIAEV